MPSEGPQFEKTDAPKQPQQSAGTEDFLRRGLTGADLQSAVDAKPKDSDRFEQFEKQIDGVVQKSKDRLKDLPKSFQDSLHDNLVKYLRTSVERYDTDKEAGLSAAEFEKYKQDMLQKVNEIIAQYAPSAAELEARKKQQEGGAEAAAAVEKSSAVEIKDTNFNEANLQNPQGIQEELAKFNAQSADVNKEVGALSVNIGNFQQAYQRFDAGKKEWGVFLRGGTGFGLFETAPDPETERLKKQLENLKSTLDEKIQKLQEKKRNLAEYGQKLNESGDTMKRQKIDERDKKLGEIDAQGTEAERAKKKNETQYHALEAQQQKLYAQRDAMTDHRNDLAQELTGISKSRDEVRVKSDQMKTFGGQLDGALSAIDEALANDPPSPQKEDLEAKKQELLQHKGNVDAAVSQTREGEGQLNAAEQAVQKKQGEAGATLATVDNYLTKTVNPSLEAISGSINAIELAKLKNGTQREQMEAQYAEIFKTIDTVDAAVADNVLQNNLANEQVISSLVTQRQSLDAISVDRPNIWDATGGLVFGKIGEGWSFLTKDIICGAGLDRLSTWLKEITKGNTVLHYATEAITNMTIDVASGVIEGVGELINGMASMIAHPIDTLKGISTLIPIYNGVNGKWFDFSGAGNSWLGMGKALIAYENFSKGEVGKGLGKVALNVLLTATGIGAGAKGAQVANSVFRFARAGSSSIARAAMEATWAGTKAFGREFGRRAWTEGLKKAPGGISKFFKEGVGKAPARLEKFWADTIKGKNAGELAGNARKAIAEKAQAAGKALQGLGEDIADRLRGNNSVRRLIKNEIKLKASVLETTDDFAKLNEEVATMMKPPSKMTREQALAKLLKDPTKQEMVLNGLKYEKNQAQLAKLRETIDSRIYSPETNQYTRGLEEVSTLGDDLGSIDKMRKEHGIDASLGRTEALDKLLEKVKSKTPPSKAEIAKVEKWIEMNKKHGAQLDEFNKISSKIKKRRSENYDWSKDDDFKKFAKENGIDDVSQLDAKGVSELRGKFMQRDLDELFKKSGLDVNKELIRRGEALYNAENGMRRLDLSTLETRNLDEIQSAMREHIQQFAEGPNATITKDTARLIQKQIDDVLAVAKEAGVSGADIAHILGDSSDNLIYQTMESYRRQLGDHGIRHISGNIRANLHIMQEYERMGVPFTAQDRLQMMITQINHDVGYTSAIDLKGFTGTGAHPFISSQMLEKGPMGEMYRGIFEEHGYNRARQAILNHDGTEVMAVSGAGDIDAAFMNAIKFSDNLALYSFDKLPPIFYENTECAKILGQIEQAVNSGNEHLVNGLKNQMRAQILKMEASGEITTNIARGLNSAIDEINTGRTASEAFGMLAGQHADDLFTVTRDPTTGKLIPTLSMEGSAVFDMLEEALRKGDVSKFDAGSKAFAKIMGDYAEKNGCVVKNASGKVIWKPGEFLDGKPRKLADAFEDIKAAIKNNDTLSFVRGGDEMMRVKLGQPTSAKMLRGEAKAKFCAATDDAGRLKVVQEAKTTIGDRFSAIEKELKESGVTEARKAELVGEHTALQIEMRYLKDFDIATDVLKNTKEIKNLKSMEAIAKSLEQGDILGAIKEFKGVTSQLTTEQITKIGDILADESLQSAKKAEEINKVITSGYDSLFKKYDITPIERQRIIDIIRQSNIAKTVAVHA